METEKFKKSTKEIIEDIPIKTAEYSLHFIKWIFILILIYIVISSIILFFNSKYDFLQQIVTLSIGGFFGFFMGYYGWRAAQIIEIYVKNIPKKKK